MLFLGNASGHDFDFHVASWMDVAGQWREGIVYPRWAEWANWGFGEPRFIFYPPASWIAGAALGSVLPWRMVPGAFIWLALVLAGMSMWVLSREWLPPPQAVVAALLYTVNPYNLVIVYYRSDFAELLAGALFPLLIWGVLRVIAGEWRRVPSLAVIFASVWLTNAPAAVIATYSLVLIILVGCIARKSLRPLLLGASAMAGGFALAAFYILPAAWERRWVQIAQAVAGEVNPSRNFLFTRMNDPDFVLFNGKVSWIAAGVIAYHRYRHNFRSAEAATLSRVVVDFDFPCCGVGVPDVAAEPMVMEYASRIAIHPIPVALARATCRRFRILLGSSNLQRAQPAAYRGP